MIVYVYLFLSSGLCCFMFEEDCLCMFICYGLQVYAVLCSKKMTTTKTVTKMKTIVVAYTKKKTMANVGENTTKKSAIGKDKGNKRKKSVAEEEKG